MEALRKKEREDETQFTTRIGGKTSLGSQLFRFVKFHFPVIHLMAYYAETGHSREVWSNRLTLQITLISTSFHSASLFLWVLRGGGT